MSFLKKKKKTVNVRTWAYLGTPLINLWFGFLYLGGRKSHQYVRLGLLGSSFGKCLYFCFLALMIKIEEFTIYFTVKKIIIIITTITYCFASRLR